MFHAEKDTHEEEDMERQKRQGAEYEFYGKLPLKKAIPLGLQHVLAMFVGNLTPILIISGACGIAGEEFGSLQVDLLQNAMLIAGIVTLIQLFAIGPVGGKVPIIMGTSSGFIGVFNSVVQVMGGGILSNLSNSERRIRERMIAASSPKTSSLAVAKIKFPSRSVIIFSSKSN